MGRQLGAERWRGAVDVVGSRPWSTCSHRRGTGHRRRLWSRARIGHLVPFVTRAVTLADIDTANAPMSIRSRAWARSEIIDRYWSQTNDLWKQAQYRSTDSENSEACFLKSPGESDRSRNCHSP